MQTAILRGTDSLSKKMTIAHGSEAGCYLDVEVSPASKEPGMLGTNPWRGTLKISIASPPISGKANAELIEIIESKFPEVKGRIRIARGEKSHSKRLFIPLYESIVKKRLGLPDD